MSEKYQKYDEFLFDIQLLKTSIMAYNINKDKEKFFLNLKNLQRKINISPTKLYVSDNENQHLLKPIIALESFDPIEDKNIIYDREFLTHVHTIFEKIIYNIAFLIENIGAYIERLQKSLNKIFIENYFLLDCSNIKDMNMPFLEGEKVSYYDYNCGRGFMQIEEGPSRFLIFNTNNDAMLDIDIVNKYNKMDIVFSEITLKVELPVSESLLETEEYKKFINELEQINKNQVPRTLFLNLTKQFGYNVTYKIPLNSKYYSMGEFTKGEKFFSVGMYYKKDTIVTIFDLFLKGQEIKGLKNYKEVANIIKDL